MWKAETEMAAKFSTQEGKKELDPGIAKHWWWDSRAVYSIVRSGEDIRGYVLLLTF